MDGWPSGPHGRMKLRGTDILWLFWKTQTLMFNGASIFQNEEREDVGGIDPLNI